MHTLFLGLGDVVSFLLKAVEILVVVQWVFWLVGADPTNPIVRAVSALIEPPLLWLRRRLPFLVLGQWDFSPVAVLLICEFLNRVLVERLWLLAAGF